MGSQVLAEVGRDASAVAARLARQYGERIRVVEPYASALPREFGTAWRQLAPAWQLPADADPCPASATSPVQCYRGANLSLPLIRQLGRPGTPFGAGIEHAAQQPAQRLALGNHRFQGGEIGGDRIKLLLLVRHRTAL